MDKDNNNVGCLDVSCFSIDNPLVVSAFKLIETLKVSCFKICSINKESQCWLWNAGEKLLWDNQEEIEL